MRAAPACVPASHLLASEPPTRPDHRGCSVPTTDERPSPSRALGRRYRLQQRLGRGGSGEVFRATDERLHRKVALKLFEIGDAPPDHIRRYAHEARVLSSLAHPNLVALLDVGADTLPDVGPVAFLVMELVEGGRCGRRSPTGRSPPG